MTKKQIIWFQILSTVIMFVLTAFFMLTSCSATNELIDSVEESNRVFMEKTKALFVIDRCEKTLICSNPQGTRFYVVKERFYPLPDTIVLKEHTWVYRETRIIKNYKPCH